MTIDWTVTWKSNSMHRFNSEFSNFNYLFKSFLHEAFFSNLYCQMIAYKLTALSEKRQIQFIDDQNFRQPNSIHHFCVFR
jgi:hypothetical protein